MYVAALALLRLAPLSRAPLTLAWVLVLAGRIDEKMATHVVRPRACELESLLGRGSTEPPRFHWQFHQ